MIGAFFDALIFFVALSKSERIVFLPFASSRIKFIGYLGVLNMHVPGQVFYNASGIDSNDSARMVFVWRVRGPDDWVLLGCGHLVGKLGRPKGILAGQFSVTFALPTGCAADEIVVTDHATGRTPLPGVTVRPCSNVFQVKIGRDSTASGAVGT